MDGNGRQVCSRLSPGSGRFLFTRVTLRTFSMERIRDERRVSADGPLYAAAIVSKLVSAALSVRICRISMCMLLISSEETSMATNMTAVETAHDFATDVRSGLLQPGQKELPSKYLYDTLGSKLFDVIVELPEYGLTRADQGCCAARARNRAACPRRRGRVRTGKRQRHEDALDSGSSRTAQADRLFISRSKSPGRPRGLPP